MKIIRFTTQASACAGDLVHRAMTLPQLFEAFDRHGKTLSAKDGPNLIGSTFIQGESHSEKTFGQWGWWRQLHLVEAVHLLMLDFDGKGLDRSWSREEIMEPASGLACIEYSTWSHGTPDATSTCMRIILPYSRPVTAEEHAELYRWAMRRWDAPIDRACKDATRLMYTPRIRNPAATIEPWISMHDGAWLDPDALPDGSSVAELLEKRRAMMDALERQRQEMLQRKRAARRSATGRDPYSRRRTPKEQAQAQLDRACDDVETALPGQRKSTLFSKACWIGRWVGAGLLDEEEAFARLYSSAVTALGRHGETRGKSRVAHIRNGLARGALTPIIIDDDREDNTNQTQHQTSHTASEATEPLADERLTLPEIWQALSERIAQAMDSPGVSAIQAPAGSRKSTLARREVIERLKSDPSLRVRISCSTHELADEHYETLREMTQHEPHILVERAPARTRETCDAYAAFSAANDATPEAGSKFCRACPRLGRCPFFAQQRRIADATIVVGTHALDLALARSGKLPDCDIQIIDETPFGALKYDGSFDVSELARLEAHGEVSNASAATLEVDEHGRARSPLERLQRALVESEEEGSKRLTSDQIQAICPAEHLTCEPQYLEGEIALDEALDIQKDSARETWRAQREVLGLCVPWRAIASLQACIARQWRGAYIQRGKLHVSTLEIYPTEHATSTVFLDATTTERVARALFRVDAIDHMRVEVSQPEHLKVIWYPLGTGTRGGMSGELDPKTAWIGAAWRASLRLWGDTDGALNVTNRRFTLHDESWTAAHLSDARGDVIYHQGPESRGVNRYRLHHTCRLDSWYVPLGVVKTTTELLMDANSESSTCEIVSSYSAEARWQLEGAATAQAAARIRPFDADETHKKTLVFCDERDPRLLGFERVEEVDPRVMAWIVEGHLTAVDPLDGRELMRAVVSGAIMRSGGTYAPSVDAISSHPMTDKDARSYAYPSVTGILSPRIDSTLSTARVYLSQLITGWCYRHFDADWQRFADHVGCRVTIIAHDAPGRGVPMLHLDDVDPALVDRWMHHTSARAWQVGSEWRRRLKLPDRVQIVLASMRGLDTDQWTVGRVLDRVASLQSISSRQARRDLEHHRLDHETMRATILRLWHDAMAMVEYQEKARIMAASSEPSRMAAMLSAAVEIATRYDTQGAGPIMVAWQVAQVLDDPCALVDAVEPERPPDEIST